MKTLSARLHELETVHKEDGALIGETDEPGRYKWAGKPGTYTMEEIRARVTGVILIFERHNTRPMEQP
jgi:hypothetical protein